MHGVGTGQGSEKKEEREREKRTEIWQRIAFVPVVSSLFACS